MIRHLASIAEVVDDFDAAVRFYRHVLGFTVEPKPDGNYANVIVGGVLHFAIWRRSHAAQIIFDDEKATERVPLGFTVGFELGGSRQVGAFRRRHAGCRLTSGCS